jgi:ribose transport system ATP-binding protein
MSGTDQTAPVSAQDTARPALEATNLAKSFGGARALKGVDLSIRSGEVVALLGENGSGKSTLVKILSGYHVPEPGGTLAMNGVEVPLPVPLGQARTIGLAFVYQDLGLAPDMQVVENLFVGHRLTSGAGSFARINWAAERRRAHEIFASYGVDLDPGAQTGRLRPTSQALLAIVRAAEELREYRREYEQSGGVLVLDEPTVFLPEHEKVFLFDLVRRVVGEGFGVLFVSHDMTAVREMRTVPWCCVTASGSVTYRSQPRPTPI